MCQCSVRFGVFLTHKTTRRNQQRSIRKNGWKWGKFGYNQLVSSTSMCKWEATKKRRKKEAKERNRDAVSPVSVHLLLLLAQLWIFLLLLLLFPSSLIELSPFFFSFLSIHIRHPLWLLTSFSVCWTDVCFFTFTRVIIGMCRLQRYSGGGKRESRADIQGAMI